MEVVGALARLDYRKPAATPPHRKAARPPSCERAQHTRQEGRQDSWAPAPRRFRPYARRRSNLPHHDEQTRGRMGKGQDSLESSMQGSWVGLATVADPPIQPGWDNGLDARPEAMRVSAAALCPSFHRSRGYSEALSFPNSLREWNPQLPQVLTIRNPPFSRLSGSRRFAVVHGCVRLIFRLFRLHGIQIGKKLAQ